MPRAVGKASSGYEVDGDAEDDGRVLMVTFGSFVAAAVAAGAMWRLWSRRPSHRDREADLRRFGVTLIAVGLIGVFIARLFGL